MNLIHDDYGTFSKSSITCGENKYITTKYYIRTNLSDLRTPTPLNVI